MRLVLIMVGLVLAQDLPQMVLIPDEVRHPAGLQGARRELRRATARLRAAAPRDSCSLILGPATFRADFRVKGPDMPTPSMSKEADAAAQRVTELSDRMTELTKKNGLAWLGAYEKVLGNMLQLQGVK